MPRRNEAKSNTTPNTAPRRAPRGKPKISPDVEPEAAAIITPKQRPRRTPRPAPRPAPILASENQTLFIYSLPTWGEDRGESPHNYGNGGRALAEFHTYADAKQWLRDNGHYGHFLFVPRNNGRLSKGSHFEIEPLEDEASGDNDFSYLDPDDIELDDADLLNPAIVRAKIENAKLRAQLEASRNGNGHGPVFDKLLEQVLAERLKPVDPLEEMEREAQRIERMRNMFGPRRESNPAPALAPPSVDPKVAALKLIAENPSLAGIAKEVFLGKSESDSDPWAEAFTKLIDSGQLGPLVQAGAAIVGNLLSSILPKPAQGAPVPPGQLAQQNPATVPQNHPATEPAPRIQQNSQPQVDQGPMQMAPVDALVLSIIGAMKREASVEEVRNILNIAAVRHPELNDSIDELLNLPVDQILPMLIAYHPPVAQMAHAREWLQSLITSLTVEGDEFDQFTEIGKGEIS